MRRFPAIAALAFLFAVIPLVTLAQESAAIEVQALSQIITNSPVGTVEYNIGSGTAHGTGGIFLRYGDTVLIADSATVNQTTGDAVADGHVRIQQGDQIWIGEHITYNFKTRDMEGDWFRTGKSPVFAQGEQLTGNITNNTYNARRVYVTTDDVSDPAIRLRASRVKIIPGKSVEMWNAVLVMDGVPVFYFPYYKRNLGPHANNWNFQPGARSAYGPYLLSTYTWWLNDELDGKLHIDYRIKRGVGVGPDLNLHLGEWGDAALKYYYLHDQRPYTSTNGLMNLGPVPENRQRFYLGYQATPATNLNVKAQVNYQSDPFVLHDFFEGEYHINPQPNTFVEVNQYWQNWSLDALSTPRINDFFDQVERLPDIRLTGFRQEVFNTPVYYESQSSAGYYRKFFADTNGVVANLNAPYSAARADTYHQFILPWTFFNWLNVAPRVGGRFTYYTDQTGPGAFNNVNNRGVFNTGLEVSTKASRLWVNATNSLLDINGLRHIIQPSANYAFVPRPSSVPSQLPQFDAESPASLLLPVDFYDYNNIDSIDSQNVIRFGLRNTLQTKRADQLDNVVDWNLVMDWRLNPNSAQPTFANQRTFSDLYSDLTFRPRSWLDLASQIRYDINGGELNLAYHQIAITPNDRWSWGVGHLYERSGFLGAGDNFITSTMFFRVNENWGLRSLHNFNAQNGRLQEQLYSIYRDLRSWTGALTFRVTDNGLGPKDYTVAFTFSLKAHPRYAVGDDTVQAYRLVGE